MDHNRMQSGMFNSLHHPQVFDSIVAVNTVNVVHLFAVFQRFDKCVGHKSMDKFFLASRFTRAAVTQVYINVRTLAFVIWQSA